MCFSGNSTKAYFADLQSNHCLSHNAQNEPHDIAAPVRTEEEPEIFPGIFEAAKSCSC